jgi:hypothetical protein
MKSSNILTLTGVGYLTEVIRQHGQKTAKINVIHEFSTGATHTDQIWINCIIRDFKLQSKIALVERSIELGKTIIIGFDAQYIGLDHCQYGITEDDPNQFLQFKGELQHIKSLYINGTSINTYDDMIVNLTK